ncbi:MAG: GTP cyclohydrolase [Eubacteriales bacterium SKADARSKE-1]|nr:GTP cyclohydrolase [Eubacteriales bacterium SKADARSKE-1]
MIDKKKIEHAIAQIIEAIGEDVQRQGLCDTPKRVASMYSEIFSGTDDDPQDYVKVFNEMGPSNEIITVCDIPFYSVCEHHILPFFGKVHIAYIPKDGKILGLSKFSRIIDCFAKRLQIQERLTSQIADFLYEQLDPDGLSVIMEAEHLCMTMRGVKSFGSKTRSIALRGVFKNDNEKRSEMMDLIYGGRN